MTNEPTFKRQGIRLSPAKEPMTFAGSFCECDAPLYKFNNRIICKSCSKPSPKRKF